MNNANNNTKNSTSSCILSIVFMVWFVASIGGMLYISKQDNKWPLLALLGQYFLVFGLVFLVNSIKNKKILGPEIIVTLVGAICVYAGIVLPKATPEERESFTRLVPFMFLGLFTFVGLILIINAIPKRKKPATTNCTTPVIASCIDVESYESSDGINMNTPIYCPIYEFYYNGATYRVKGGSYSNYCNVQIGDQCCLEINPTNPYEYSIPDAVSAPDTMSNLIAIGIGVVFIIVSVLGIVIYYNVWKNM